MIESNCRSFNLADKLWLPTSTDYSPSPLNNHDLIIDHSWFTVDKFQSSIEHNPQILNIDNQLPSNNAIRAIKLQLNPSKEVRQHYIVAFNIARWVYNQCVNWLHISKEKPTKQLLSQLFIGKESKKEDELQQKYNGLRTQPQSLQDTVDSVPYCVKFGAITDFVDAYYIQCQMVKEKKRKNFEMHFRSKKRSFQESIYIPHRDINHRNNVYYCFPRSWGHDSLNVFGDISLMENIKRDCRMLMTKPGNFYLVIPRTVECQPQQLTDHLKVASLDPGERVFQTVYDSHGQAYNIGKKDDKVFTLLKIAQRMRDGIKRTWVGGQKIINENRKPKYVGGERIFEKTKSKKTRKRLRKCAARIEEKIRNMITDIHRKTCKFLCTKYDVIILPKFESQQMIEKKDEEGNWKRKIGPETSQNLLRWSHYKFREMLKNKAEVMGRKVIVVTEEWTSKTCGNCFNIKEDLGGNKEYECKKCGKEYDRDIHAARNIMMLNWKKAGLK